MKVYWAPIARIQFVEACAFIAADSPANALAVRKRILSLIGKLPAHPFRYPPDKYKLDNDGAYRSFVTSRLRISYKVAENRIFIIRLRHTSMEPMNY